MNGIALVAELEVINTFVEVVRAETFLITSALLQLFSQPHRHFQSCPLLCRLFSSTSMLGASMFSAGRDGLFDTNKDHVHGELTKAYYARCSSVPRTLLISEATFLLPKQGLRNMRRYQGPPSTRQTHHLMRNPRVRAFALLDESTNTFIRFLQVIYVTYTQRHHITDT